MSISSSIIRCDITIELNISLKFQDSVVLIRFTSFHMIGLRNFIEMRSESLAAQFMSI